LKPSGLRLVTDAVKILPNTELVKMVLEGDLSVSAAVTELENRANPAPAEAEEVEEAEEEETPDNRAKNTLSEIGRYGDELLELLNDLNELSGQETAEAAAAGIVRRLEDAGYVEREKKKKK
jgi:hypothetical protein